MNESKERIIEKIDIVLKIIEDFHRDFSRIDRSVRHSYAEKCFVVYPLICETIECFAPNDSYYEYQARVLIKKCDTTNGNSLFNTIISLNNLLIALKTAYENDLLINIKELYHADIFNDFLEMGEYLLKEGYKDAAAVIIGGVIEDHIRKLAQKRSINILREDRSPVKTNQIVSELYSKNEISRGDNKNLIAWLEIRNNAAHGKYSEYNENNVSIFLQGVSEFITRYPA